MRLLIILLLVLPISLASEDVELPSSTERVLTKHDKAVKKAKAAYLEELNDISSNTIKALEKEKAKVVKSGNLELAMAVKAKIEEIQSLDPAEGLNDEVDLLGEVKKKKVTKKNNFPSEMVGVWVVNFDNGTGRTITIKENGSAASNGYEFQIEMHPKLKKWWAVSWSNGKIETFEISEETMTIHHWKYDYKFPDQSHSHSAVGTKKP